MPTMSLPATRSRAAFAAPLAATLALLLVPANAAEQAADLFSYAEGARFVKIPEGSEIMRASASPLNLIDGSRYTDWEGEGKGPSVFILELEEQTELTSIVFDADFLNKDGKTPRAFQVEISAESPTSGYEPVASGDLRINKDNQRYSFNPKEPLPTGRWVRLTILDNHGDDYVAFTGFRGYGKRLTSEVAMPSVTGTYDGANGWGKLQLIQNGEEVTGCYDYQGGKVAGTVSGRVMTIRMTNTDSSGDESVETGYFQISPDGRTLIGISRASTEPDEMGFASYWSATRVSNKARDCG
jgi:hypothetical protein